MADSIAFHQIWYKEGHKTDLFPFAKPFFNPTFNELFENQVIAANIPWMTADKIAICSWALRRKMNLRIPPRRDLTEDVLQEDFDVMAFTKNSPSHDMLSYLDHFHPGALDALKLLWDLLGMALPSKVSNPIYQNAFCARLDVYQEYVKKFLIPAIVAMNTVPELKKLLWVDSGYRVTTLNIPVDFDVIEKNLGVRFYPLHPFILERCFSCWIEGQKLKITYL